MLHRTLLLVAVAFALVLFLSSASPSSAALTDSEKSTLKAALDKYANYLNKSVLDAKSRLTTTRYTTCSGYDAACSPTYTAVTTIDFTTTIPLAYDKMQLRPGPGVTYTQHLDDVCVYSDMTTRWKQNLADSGRTMLYQYATTADFYGKNTNLYGGYPMADFGSTCPDYIPLSRPWATAGATGQKDVVILIDASSKESNSASRLALAKKIAKEIIRSLSYRDFAAVVAYGDSPDASVTLLERGSVAGTERLGWAVDNVTLMAGNGTNVGSAMQAAVSIFETSATLGSTSKCTRSIVLLSNGNSDGESPTPGSILDSSKNRDIVVFSMLVQPNQPTTKQVTYVTALGCATRGLTRIFRADADLVNVTSFVEYFASLATDDAVRFSEVYTDALGQGRILSLAAPVYVKDSDDITRIKMVVSLDVKFSQLSQSGAVSEVELNDYNLNELSCRSLNQDDSSQDAVIKSLQLNTCTAANLDAIGFGVAQPGDDALDALPGIIAGTVLGSLLLGSGAAVLAIGGKGPMQMVAFGACGVYCVFFIAVVSILFDNDLAKQMIRRDNYEKVEVVMTESKCSPVRCCEVSSCSYCSDAPSSAPKCRDAIASLEPATSCSSNWHCCSKRQYECACRVQYYRSCTSSYSSSSSTSSSSSCTTRSRTVCSTCTTCVTSTSNHECSVGCGTCYSCRAVGRMTFRGVIQQQIFPEKCTLKNAEDCKVAFEGKYRVGDKREMYANPANSKDLVANVDPDSGLMGAFIACVTIQCLALVVAYIAALGGMA